MKGFWVLDTGFWVLGYGLRVMRLSKQWNSGKEKAKAEEEKSM